MKTVVITISVLLSLCAKSQTQFGVLVSFPDSSNTSSNIIDVTNELGAKCVRQTLVMNGWDGTSNRYDQFRSAGYKILLNVNYGNPVVAPIPFPTDTVAYKVQLSSILDIHSPEVVVIENEEITEDYHSGPIEDYINELKAAIGICHAKGLKVTNAGLLTSPLCILVYNDYLSRGLKAEAADFKTRTFNPIMSNYLTHPQKDSGLGLKVDKCKTLIAAFAGMNLDYVNFHIAEIVNANGYSDGKTATPKVYQEIIDYLKKTTGKAVISNEIAQKNLSPSLVTSMLTEFKKTGIDYAIWYSDEGDNLIIPDSALHNYDKTLRLNGIAFSNFMIHKTADLSKPGLYASAIASFDTICLSGSTPPKVFTLVGSSLLGNNVTIGPLQDFNFSTSSDSTYNSTLTISGYGKSFTKLIYVKAVPSSLGFRKGGIPIYGGGVVATSVPVTATIINSSPALSGNISPISCYGNINDGAVDLTATGGSGTFTYSWTSPDYPFYKSATEDITDLKPGNYNVEVTSQGGCKISAAYAVIEPDKLDFTVIQDSNIVCKNGSTTVTVTATGGTLPYNGAGVFTVNSGTRSYTVADTKGCAKTESFYVPNGTDDGPSKPSAITGADADSKGVCGNGNYVYSINPVDSATSYTWKAPDGITIVSSSADGTSATINASSSFSPGSLTVSANNTCGSSPVQTKTISQIPAKPGSITGPLSVSRNKTGLVYSVSPAIQGLTYAWTVNNGAKITSGQNTESITVTWGIFAGRVTVKAGNDCGISNGIFQDISITKLLSGNGGIDSAAVVTSSYNNSFTNLYAVPNPAKQSAYIVFNTGGESNYTIKITDLSGKLLQVKQGTTVKGENKSVLDVHNYAAGIYIVTIENSKGLKRTMKLVKE